MSRTHAAAFCAALSTAAVAVMSGMVVLVGGGSCDIRGCAAEAVLPVPPARAAAAAGVPAPAEERCAGRARLASTSSPATPTTSAVAFPSLPTTPTRADDCAPPGPPPAGGMVTGRAPAP